MIEAYCDRRSYAPGDVINLQVSTDAKAYRVQIIRDGLTPHIVAQTRLAGAQYGLPTDVVENGCGWPAAATISVPADWTSGFYRVSLTTEDGQACESFFVVRASRPTAKILWVIETATWNAYNSFGGANTYTSDKAYINGAAIVSYLRPLPQGFISMPADAPRYVYGDGGPGTPTFRRWSEDHGLDPWGMSASWGARGQVFQRWLDAWNVQLDFAVSEDLERFPDILDGYEMFLSVGHDEYWSWRMRDTVEAFINKGGNAVFLSGNTCYWQVRFQDDHQQMVAYKNRVENDPVMGTPDARYNTGLWSHRLTERPENAMIGLTFTRAGYSRLHGATPNASGGYTIYRADHWALQGTGASYGDQLGAAVRLVGYECDGCEFQFKDGLPYPTGKDGTPINLEIIGVAPAILWNRETGPPYLFSEEGAIPDVEVVSFQVEGRIDAETIARYTHGHAVIGTFVSKGGGTVFNGGTTDWVQCLDDPWVAQVTRNVFRRLSGAV